MATEQTTLRGHARRNSYPAFGDSEVQHGPPRMTGFLKFGNLEQWTGCHPGKKAGRKKPRQLRSFDA